MLARPGGAILAALLLGATSASAQGGFLFTRLGSGARAAGMANAFIAVSDDGTAWIGARAMNLARGVSQPAESVNSRS